MAVFPDVTIKVGGEDIREFISVSLHQELMKHHRLVVSLRRDHFEQDSMPVFKVSQKLIGEPVKLLIQSPFDEKAEFVGVVTEIRTARSDDHKGDVLQIVASSPDAVLSDHGHFESFEERTIGHVVDYTLQRYGLVTRKRVNPSPNPVIHYTTQFNESAFAFLSRLAVRYGQWFLYDGTTLHFGPLPQKSTSLEYRKDLFEFEFSMKLNSTQYEYVSHDFHLNHHHTINSELALRRIPKISRPAYEKGELFYKHYAYHFFQGSMRDRGIFDGLFNEARLAKGAAIANMMVCKGSSDNPEISLGSIVEITEYVGQGDEKQKIDHGKFIVIALDHFCDRNGNYHNTFIGLPSEVELPPYTDPNMFVIAEPQSARVTDNKDPEGLGRIRVSFFWQEKRGDKTPWLRIASPHGGKDKGFHFIPEIGEEVLVGFVDGNADKPFVMGSLYHGLGKPADRWRSFDNDFKAIRTRSGHTIEFIDKVGREEIRIYDNDPKNFNYSVTLESHSKKITVEAKGDMEIKANNIRISANQDFVLKATNIKQDAAADMSLSATGNMGIKTNSDMSVSADNNMEGKAGNSMELSANNKIRIDGGMQVEQKASAAIVIDGGGKLEQKAAIVKIN